MAFRRWGWVAAGAGMLATATVVIALRDSVGAPIVARDLAAATLLEIAADSPDQARVVAALDELLARHEAGSVATTELAELAPAALRTYTDPESTWLEQWGSVLGHLLKAGELSSADQVTILKHASDREIRVRRRVRQGDRLPIRINATDRPIAGVQIHHRYIPAALVDGGVRVWSDGLGVSVAPLGAGSIIGPRGRGAGRLGATWATVVAPGRGSDQPDHEFAIEAPVGQAAFSLTIAVITSFDTLSRDAASNLIDAHAVTPLETFERSVGNGPTRALRFLITQDVGPMEVLPGGMLDDVPEVSTDEVDRTMAAAIRLSPILLETNGWSHRQAPHPYAHIHLHGVAPRPVMAAYDAYAEADGRAWYLGPVTIQAGDRRVSTGLGMHHLQSAPDREPRQLPAGVVGPFDPPRTMFDFERVDVRLRPSPRAARGSVEVQAIWGRELLFRDVPIWPEAADEWRGLPDEHAVSPELVPTDAQRRD